MQNHQLEKEVLGNNSVTQLERTRAKLKSPVLKKPSGSESKGMKEEKQND